MTQQDLKRRKEGILGFMKSESYTPMRRKELAAVLSVPQTDREEFAAVLEALLSDGVITMDTKGRFRADSPKEVKGIYRGTSREFGFVTPEDGGTDIFVPEGSTLSALNGDTVLVVITEEREELQRGRSREGRVVKILEHANDTLVGTYFKKKEYGFVIAEDKKLGSDIFIDGKASMGAVSGHKVVVKITDFGDNHRNPMGKIVEILGHINDPETDLATILRAYGIETEYPQEVMSETEGIPDEVGEKEKAGRLDLRGELMITIDGEDAKDLDDAVSLTKTNKGWRLGVHIADVSEYVRENHPLDKEALKRGTSVYLINKVVPMLPHKLSNGICSLNAGEERLALSCIMDLDEAGNITGHRIAESLILVDRRTSYTEINRLLLAEESTEEADRAEYGEIYDMVKNMGKLAVLLEKKRVERGAIDFDLPESSIVLDEHGKPVEIKPYERNAATRLIEDFMLAANETVAEDFFWQEIPFVYRVHETPEEEKMERLAVLARDFGYVLKGEKSRIHPKELQRMLSRADGTPEEAMLARIALRSMKQAKYKTDCEGHFGLATKYYCHFTSPIRRYPDLQIHRIIKETLRGEMTEHRIAHYNSILPEVADRSSRRERTADEAERELEKMKKCEYAQEHIGMEAEGFISGLTSYGMYVELDNTVEGMIRLDELHDDYYIFDEENYCLTGQKRHKVYRLGQRVKIAILSVDKILKTIDFLPAER